MPTLTTRQLVDNLEDCGLLAPEQIAAVRDESNGSPSQLVRRLIAEGRLTKWQARRLVQGSTHFFHGKGNKYKLLRKIGRGGMGVVYKAEQVSLGRIVALKVMSPDLMKNSRNVSRFLREIQVTAKFDHPNIIRAYDADLHDGNYFLVMEYLRGRNVREWLGTSKKPAQCKTACDLIMQAAHGLQHVHERRLVHRDIKPSNLYLTVDAERRLVVKLLDLGLSRLTTELKADGGMTRAGYALGTLHYMAPEQVRSSRDVDIRADIYALGCTLFELLTRRLPFSNADPLKSAMIKLNEDAPRVSSIWPQVPRELDEIVARMLEREPDRRYDTPAEVAAAMSEVKESLAKRKSKRASATKAVNRHADDSSFSDVSFLSPDVSHESLTSQDTLGVPGSLTVELARLAEMANGELESAKSREHRHIASARSGEARLRRIDQNFTPRTDSLAGIHRALIENIQRVDLLASLSPTLRPSSNDESESRTKQSGHRHANAESTDAPRNAVHSSMIAGTWTAFEALAGDLWEAALNANPQWGLLAGDALHIRTLAGDAQQPGERTHREALPGTASLAEMFDITNGSFDLSGKMGTLHRRQFQFCTLRGLREAFAAAISPAVQDVDALLADNSLDALVCLRNVLVHKAGVADEDDASLLNRACAPVRVESGSTVQLDREIVSAVIDTPLDIALSLLKAIDSQIASK